MSSPLLARLKSKKRGFTLMEMTLVMGVIGGIIGAVWHASSNASEMKRENLAFTELQTVTTNVLETFGGRGMGGCAGNATSCLITAKVIPSIYINATDNTKADNPWSPGQFVVYNMDGGATPIPRDFRLSFYNVSQSGCMSLVLAATACNWGQSGCPYSAITAGNTVRIIPGQSGFPPNWPGTMTATEANTICGSNVYNSAVGNNSVEFDYLL